MSKAIKLKWFSVQTLSPEYHVPRQVSNSSRLSLRIQACNTVPYLDHCYIKFQVFQKRTEHCFVCFVFKTLANIEIL